MRLLNILLVCFVARAADTVTIYESDGQTRTNIPVMLGRAAHQSDYPSGTCPHPAISGTPLATWQYDGKTAWSDNSAKFGVRSFIVPSLPANGSVTVTFAPDACPSSTPLTQAQMVNFNSGNWGAQMQITAASTTVTRNASTMLSYTDPGVNSFGDCKNDYWLKGAVVTAVIVQDCTLGTGTGYTTHWDFGWTWNGTSMTGAVNCIAADCSTASNANSLHPWFVLYFFPGSNAVRADMILENTWTDRAQDQLINVNYLTGSTPASQLNYAGVPRKLTDVSLTSGSDVITSTSANFQSADVGDSFSTSPGGDTTICSVQSTTQATLCAPTAAGGTNQTVYLNDWLWGQMYRKSFWTGTGNPGNYLVDHNWPYVVSTGMVVPYDTAKNASPDSNVLGANGCGNNSGTDWTCFSQAVLTNSGFTQTWSDFGDRGGHGGLDETYSQADGDPTPMSRQALLYLTNMSTCGTANGACSKAWFMMTGTRGARDSSLPASVPGGAGIWNNAGNIAGLNMRESRTTAGHYYCPSLADRNALSSASSCGSSSDTPFGRPPSRYYAPAFYSAGGAAGHPSGSASYSYGHWTPVAIRFLEWTYSAYLLSGDYYYALQTQMNGAYAAASLNPASADYQSNGFFAHMNAQGAILRQSAGTLDAILKARTVSPDNSVEQTYFDSILASNAEVFEGIMSITGTGLTPTSTNPTCTGYSITSSNRWDWGRCTLASYCGAGEPQGASCSPVAQALHMPVSGQAESQILANVDAKGFEANSATAGNPTVISNSGGGYSTASVGDTVYCANATGNWTALNGLQTVTASTSSSLTLNVNTTGVAGPLTGSLACWWGSFGQISAAASANPTQITSTRTPASYGFTIYGAADQTGGTNWSGINGAFTPTHVGNNTFTIPVNASAFPSFSQSGAFYSELGLKQDKTTDTLQGWMTHMWGVIVNEMAGQGVTYFSTIASELNKRLIEELQDPTYNPWLVAKNFVPLKNPSGGAQVISLSTTNPYFTTWAQVKAAYTDPIQSANTFYPALSYDMGSNPCTDHAYALLARAQAAFLPGVTSGTLSGTAAWTWANANIPFFNNSPASGDPGCGSSDAQIKFALAPPPALPVTLSCSPSSGIYTYGTFTCTESGTTAVASVRWYFDGRLEAITPSRDHGQWKARPIHVTATDERAMSYCAEAYDANGNLLASAPSNGGCTPTNVYTLRVNNIGLNASMSCSDAGGAVNSGGTTTAANSPLTCTVPSIGNAASVSPSPGVPITTIDGLTSNDPLGANPSVLGGSLIWAPHANVDYANNAFVSPVINVAKGDPVYIGCYTIPGPNAPPCSGSMPVAAGTYYSYPISLNSRIELQLATTYAKAMANIPDVTFSSSGVSMSEWSALVLASQISVYPWSHFTAGASLMVNQLGGDGASGGAVNPYYIDGFHRIEDLLQITPQPAGHTITFSVPSTSITCSTSHVALANIPLMQDIAAGSSSVLTSVPSICGWSSTMYAVLDANGNGACLSTSQAFANAGICFVGTGSPGAGPYTFTTTTYDGRFWETTGGFGYGNQPMGSDIQWVNFASGSGYMCELVLPADPIVLAVGETFDLFQGINPVHGLNCDQSTRPLTASSLLYMSSNTPVATISASGVITAVAAGDAMLSIVDNTHDRVRTPAVIVQADHSHYPCFTVGHGIQSTYTFTGGHCIYLVTPFGGYFSSITINNAPNPPIANLVRNAGFNSLIGGTSGAPFNGTLNTSNFTTFLSSYLHNCASYPSSCSIWSTGYQIGFLQSAWQNGWFSYYGPNLATGCVTIWQLQQSVMSSDLYGQMIADLAPYTTNLELADEQSANGCYSLYHNGTPILNMVPSQANGDDGTGHPGGLTRIDVSSGVGTAALKSFVPGGSLWHAEISGAATPALNGPMNFASFSPNYLGAFPAGTGNALGGYITTVSFPTLAANGCYNYDGSSGCAANPSLQINYHQGYDPFPSAIGAFPFTMLSWGTSTGGTSSGTATASAPPSSGQSTITVVTGTLPTSGYNTGGSDVTGNSVPILFVNGIPYAFSRSSGTMGGISAMPGVGIVPTQQTTAVCWSTGPASYVINSTGTLVTVNWPCHPLTQGMEVLLSNGDTLPASACATAGLAGTYRADVVDANTVNLVPFTTINTGGYTITVNAGNDPTCQINERVRMANDIYLRLTHTWISSNSDLTCYPSCVRPPVGGSQQGGGNRISWALGYGVSATSDFIPQNITTNTNDDRFGDRFWHSRYTDLGVSYNYLTFLVDGTSIRSKWANPNLPVIQETNFTQNCTFAAPSVVNGTHCFTDVPGVDKFETLISRFSIYGSAMANIIGGRENVSGMKPYQISDLGYGLNQQSLRSGSGQNAQIGGNFTEPSQNSDWWTSFAAVAGTAQRNARCLLSPLMSSPDLGRQGLIASVAHKVPSGDICIWIWNISERPEPYSFQTAPWYQGGPAYRYDATVWGTQLFSIAPGSTISGILCHGCSSLFVFQPSGASAEVPSISVPLAPLLAVVSGATSLTVRVKHYRDDQLFNTTNCGSTGTCSVWVDARNVGAWVQYVYLNSSGQIIRQSDWEWQPPV